MINSNRLDQIFKRMTPKQLFISWLDEAQRFESFEAHLRSVPPRYEHPMEELGQNVSAAIRESFKNRPKSEFRAALFKVEQEVNFLRSLMVGANGQIWAEAATRARNVQRLNAELRSGIGSALRRFFERRPMTALPRKVREAFVRFMKLPPTTLDHEEWRSLFESYAEEVCRLGAEAKFLGRRYFDGHAILWKDAVDELKVHADFIERLLDEKDCRDDFTGLADDSDAFARTIAIAAGKTTAGSDGQGSRSEFYDARAAFERIKKSIDPSKTAKPLIERAKAEINRFDISEAELEALRCLCADMPEVKSTIPPSQS